jgi:hypothetical protein
VSNGGVDPIRPKVIGVCGVYIPAVTSEGWSGSGAQVVGVSRRRGSAICTDCRGAVAARAREREREREMLWSSADERDACVASLCCILYLLYGRSSGPKRTQTNGRFSSQQCLNKPIKTRMIRKHLRACRAFCPLDWLIALRREGEIQRIWALNTPATRWWNPHGINLRERCVLYAHRKAVNTYF